MDKSHTGIYLDFEPISRRVGLTLDNTLYEHLIKMGVQIRQECGGRGTCGKCKIMIQTGNEYLNQPTEAEKKLINKEEFKKYWRLACQARVNPKSIHTLKTLNPPQFRIYLPDELLIEDFKILSSGKTRQINLNPVTKKYFLKVKKSSLESPISDLERVLEALYVVEQNLQTPIKIDNEILKKIPEILKTSDNQITIAILDNIRIISCESGDTKEKNFGIAFDIGTTTLVGYLINLNDGKIYSISSKLNPQTAYGEDVITRMTFIKDHENGLETLNNVVISALNEIIMKTCSKAEIDPSNIYEATIVGNSVMHHIFHGFDPYSIGVSPYVPIVQQALNTKSHKLNLKIYNQGNVYTLPLIAGFVGADTMGVIISSNIEKEKDLTLAIDIGTNGEIIIGNTEILATGSCAAGSALEGAHIKNGMRAASGAIDTVKINPQTLDVEYTTIKNRKPIGICGSGLIDAVAEMLKSKILTRNGNFNKELIDHERILKIEDNLEFIIAKKEETQSNKEISISQNDIRQIQMAKAAFYSGTNIILKNLDIPILKSLKDIKQIFLAGAFGNYINKENAKFIGMIPDIPNDKIFQIGNAAGIGAQYCLINKDLRIKANELLKKIQYVEIATKKEFQKEYAEAMYFPHRNLDLFPSLKDYKNIKVR